MKVFVFDLLAYGEQLEHLKVGSELPYPLSNRYFKAEVAVRTYAEHLDAWEEMDRLGYDGVGFNEHHCSPYGLMNSPNLMAAAAAQRTKRLKLLIYGNLLPLHEPLRLAEELAMLDCLSNGRLISGFARGIPREYQVHNIPLAESRARFEEAYEIITGAWREEVFSYQGKFWSYKDVALWPRPLVVFANGKAVAKLTPAQRKELQQAATAALPGSMRVVQGDEHEAAQDLCRIAGFSVGTATQADLAALRTAVVPVYAQLEQDPATRSAIGSIRTVAGNVTAEAPPSCPSQASSAAAKSPLDGVYTMDTKIGDDPSDSDVVPENYGHWVFVFHGSHFADTQQYQNACTWGYGKVTVTGARMAWTFTDGGGIAPDGAANKPGEYFVFGWSQYRGTVTLTPVPGEISPDNFRLKPWHRVSATPSFSSLNKSCPPPANALG